MIYLASPYSHPDPDIRRGRAQIAAAVAAELTKRGHQVYSPIAYSTFLCRQYGISDGCDGIDGPNSHEYWLEHGLAMLRGAEQMWVLKLEGWEDSSGIAREMGEASKIGMQVQYIEFGDLPKAQRG